MTATLHKLPANLGDIRSGSVEVRLATSAEDIDASQALRYHVFYEEMGAKPTPEMEARKRDFDDYDEHCDHLLVIDHMRKSGNKVVGTYRLIRREAAVKCGGFYSRGEYDISRILEYPGEILELGRSCIDAEYRTGTIMQILWRGLSAYIFRYNVALMFGCASLPGSNPAEHAVPLSYLYYHHLAPPALRTRAVENRYVDMRDGAVIDRQWNSTDVFIIVKTDLITSRYLRHYERSNKKDIALPVE